jgi:hypothetical protein
MIDGDDCGAISGMNEWQGKPKYLEDPGPEPLCSPQIPNEFSWDRTRSTTVESGD